MQKGEKYILQGCYGQEEPSDVGKILGANVTVRNAAGKDGMSLLMCLDFCKSPASPEVKPRDEQSLSLFVGLSDGKTCYCGGSINSTAKEVKHTNCTVPCAGNDAIACGGNGYMLVYKLSTSSEFQRKQGDGPYDDDTGSKGQPGRTAGIALGTISGFALLAFLIFYGARIYKRRRQRQARENNEHGAGAGDEDDASDTKPADSAATLGKTNRLDLRNVDPIVIDFAPLAGDRRASNAGRPKQIIAASTGAEWRTGNPGTPRAAVDTAPKLATNGAQGDAWDDIPSTPTILQPESVAQNPGLGERAWHRRRLSAPMPPAGYRYSDGPSAFGDVVSREARETQTSQGTGDVGNTPWEDDWDSLMPAPLTLPPLGYSGSGASASAGDDEGPLTAKTMWTVPSEHSPSGSSGRGVDRGGKTGKTE